MAIFILGCSSKNVVSIVQEEQGQNVILSDGNRVLKESFDKVYLYNEDFIKIQKANLFGMVSYDGKIVLTPQYESISPLYNGYAIIEAKGKYGIVNDKMQIIVEPLFEKIKIEEYFFVVQKNKQNRCMNSKAEIISEPYDHIYYFVGDFARVEKDGKFGFIDTACKEVAAVNYDYASDFINGFAKVKTNETVAYLNEQMKIITKEEYKDGYFFQGK